jgi:L-iditol 2-dehydrogenase
MLTVLALQRGVTRVIASDSTVYRRRQSLEVGADAALDPLEVPLLHQIYVLNAGHKPDVVIVTPSSVSAMQQGVNLVEAGGTVLFFAPPPPSEVLPVVPNRLFFREVTLRTGYSAGPYETRLALEYLQQKRVLSERVITYQISIQEAPQAFSMVSQPGETLKVVVTNM